MSLIAQALDYLGLDIGDYDVVSETQDDDMYDTNIEAVLTRDGQTYLLSASSDGWNVNVTMTDNDGFVLHEYDD